MAGRAAALQSGPAPGWAPPPRPRLIASASALAITAGFALLLAAALSPGRMQPRRPPPMLVVVVRGDPVRPPPPAPPIVPFRVAAAPATVPPPVIRIATPVPAPPPFRAVRRSIAVAAVHEPPLRAALPIPVVNARPPKPPLVPGDPHAVDTLEGRIRSAVQAALRYPASARDMGDQGRVLVGFDYRDQTVSSVRLLVGSGNDRLDMAALATVRDADYPPPGALAGRTLALAVWVTFRIDNDG